MNGQKGTVKDMLGQYCRMVSVKGGNMQSRKSWAEEVVS